MNENREKELKEKINRCMASMAISDNSITISQLQKIINESFKELRAIRKATTQTEGDD